MRSWNNLVYLAGPISGLNWKDSTDWREYAKELLARRGLVGLSPLRGKEYLAQESRPVITHDTRPLSTSRGIITRDHMDVSRSGLVLANLLAAETVSIGTVLEIGWAWLYRKPVILVIESDGNLHDHPMLRECVGYRVMSIDAAVDLAANILIPDGF
jgi:nucleoside 2-deoxyribosyltransferase